MNMLLGAMPELGQAGGITLELFRICETAGPLAVTPKVVNRSVIAPPLFAATSTFGKPFPTGGGRHERIAG